MCRQTVEEHEEANHRSDSIALSGRNRLPSDNATTIKMKRNKKEAIMRRKEIVSVLFLAAMIMAAHSGPVVAQSTGGTQSERSGTDTQTPLSPNSPSSGSGTESNMGKTPTTPRKSTGNMKDDKSIGGSRSERSGQTPLPPKSRFSGAGDESNMGKTSKTPRKSTGNMKDDKSVGGSQSDRSGTDTQTPLQPNSPSSGSDTGKSPTR